jgi:hypothetical protein
MNPRFFYNLDNVKEIGSAMAPTLERAMKLIEGAFPFPSEKRVGIHA